MNHDEKGHVGQEVEQIERTARRTQFRSDLVDVIGPHSTGFQFNAQLINGNGRRTGRFEATLP
jgi:hypothetical protein